MTKIKLVSTEDASINHIIPVVDGGFFESRFVQRDSSYFIVYLSSHSGCNQSCRMCHLTQSGQTMMTSATLQDYLEQAKNVLKDVDFEMLKSKGLTRVKFSFMARGEPLLNETIQTNWDLLRRELRNLIPGYFDVQFNISTILPKEFNLKLESIFKTSDVTIYYSIYGYKEEFRKKWLGKAKPMQQALTELYLLTHYTKTKIKFHSAFIKGENDSDLDISILNYKLKEQFKNFEFNIVRYNPYSPKFGEESDTKTRFLIRKTLNAKVKSRVGMDVNASCGMFYGAVSESST